ncbi:MAG: DNA polymerase III subunit delta' [Rhodothermales bacterium]|nr:DNA polymerase III subunit delta' [Rhodothermales bacterium]
MVWSSVINQDRVVGSLKSAISSDRVAHAYLFHGPDGTGKKAAAFAFAQALQCQDRRGPDMCGNCNACSKASRLIHPDIHVILPYPGEQDPREVTLRISELAADPYAPVDFVHAPNGLGAEKQSTNKQLSVKRERIAEELLRPISFTAVEGRYKIAVLTDVDLVNAVQSNVILKLLEEPPPNTVFVLTTTRVDRLLPTILSRCQQIRFELLETPLIVEALRERFDAEDTQLESIARLADGSMTRAIQIAGNQELLGLRLLSVDFIRECWTRDAGKLYKKIQLLTSGGREFVKSALATMLHWIRDLILLRATGDVDRVVNSDQSESTIRFLKNLPDADLEGMVDVIEEAIRLTERNVNTTTLFIALSDALHDLMHGRPVGGLYSSLVDTEEYA